jgi:hypothetical protein
MKKPNSKIERAEEGFELKLKPRPSKKVTLQIPEDTLESLEKIAATRDTSVEALIKFYIGQNLRNDVSKLFAEQLIEKATKVLARHIQSREELSAIIQEIRAGSV